MLMNLLYIDLLTAFGLVAVGLMMLFYAVESHSRNFTLLFAGACVMGSARKSFALTEDSLNHQPDGAHA